jgi:hypothetical protein
MEINMYNPTYAACQKREQTVNSIKGFFTLVNLTLAVLSVISLAVIIDFFLFVNAYAF